MVNHNGTTTIYTESAGPPQKKTIIQRKKPNDPYTVQVALQSVTNNNTIILRPIGNATTQQIQPKIQTIPIIAQPQTQAAQPQQLTVPQLQTLQQIISSPPPPSTSITSPPPPALVATTQTALKLTAAPQRIITARPSPGQVVVLTQVKQDSPGNQVIKNLLNQPRAPMTQSMVNGLAMQPGQEVQTVYLQVDNSNLIHMGSAVPANLQVSFLGNLEPYWNRLYFWMRMFPFGSFFGLH